MPQKNDFNVLIIDTAGRLHVDEDMMAELDSDKRKCCGITDHTSGRCHDRTGCSQCCKDLR